MPGKYNFPTDAAPVASGIPPEILRAILRAPIVVPIVPAGDPRPAGQWVLQDDILVVAVTA